MRLESKKYLFDIQQAAIRLGSSRASLRRGPGLERDRVDLAADQVAERLVDQAVAIEQGFPFELGRDDQDVVVAATRGGTGVAGVRRAVVPDLEPGGTKTPAENRLDARADVVHRAPRGRPAPISTARS